MSIFFIYTWSYSSTDWFSTWRNARLGGQASIFWAITSQQKEPLPSPGGGDPELPAAAGQEAAAELPRPGKFLPAVHTGGSTDFAAAHSCTMRRGGLDMDAGDEPQF
jgi:hypothetical protein